MGESPSHSQRKTSKGKRDRRRFLSFFFTRASPAKYYYGSRSVYRYIYILFRLSARYWLSYRLRYFADIKHISPIHIYVNRAHGTSAVFLILIRRDSAVESFYSCIIAQSIASRPSVKVSSDQEHSQNDDQGGLCPSGRIR